MMVPESNEKDYAEMVEKLRLEEEERRRKTRRGNRPKPASTKDSEQTAVLPAARGDAVFDRLHETVEEKNKKAADQKSKQDKKPMAHQLVDDLRASLDYRLGKDSEKALLEQAQILDRAFRQVLEKTDGHVDFQNSRSFEIAFKAQKQFCQTLVNVHKIKKMNKKIRAVRTRQNTEL